MKDERENPQERLRNLADRLSKANIEGAEKSFHSLLIEAMNNNPEAVRQLIELSNLFSNASVSFNKLADFIDRKFNC